MEKLSVVKNETLKGIEIYFSVKPSQDVIEFLKSNNFRFNKKSKCWYARENKYTFLVLEDLKGLLGLENKSRQNDQFIQAEQQEQENELIELVPEIQATNKPKFNYEPILQPIYIKPSPSARESQEKLKPTDIVKKVKKAKDLGKVDFNLLNRKEMLLLTSAGLVSITEDKLDGFIDQNKRGKVKLEYIGKNLILQVTP